MKHLNLDEIINIGGHRLSLNDLYQLQKANEQLAQAICESFGAEGVGGRVISGVELTDTPTEIAYTAGWMIKGGLMYKVNPLPTTTKQIGYYALFIFKKTNTYPAVTYQSGSVYQIHQQREVDIIYTNTLPSGTINVDYTSPFSVTFKRISDITTELDSVSQTVNNGWITHDQSYIQTNLLYFGVTAVASGTFLKYKKMGRTLFLNANIVLAAPSPQNFSIAFPTAISPKIAANHALIVATDTKGFADSSWVTFAVEVTSPSYIPALIVFQRSHADTALNAVSFSTVLELTS